MVNNNAPADAASNLDTQTIKPPNEAGQTPAALLKDAGAGVPEKRQEGEGGTTLPERLRDAAGIDRIPAPGTVNGTARKVEDDASTGGPVRVRQQTSMTTPDGQTVAGEVFTRRGQQYFAPNEGENRQIYLVNRDDKGAPVLEPKPARATREQANSPDATAVKADAPAAIKADPLTKGDQPHNLRGDPLNPRSAELQLRAEQNAGVPTNTGDQIQARQVPELAQVRAAAEARAQAQALALNPELKASPLVAPGAINVSADGKPILGDTKAAVVLSAADVKLPGSDARTIPAVGLPVADAKLPDAKLSEVKLPGADLKPATPIANPIANPIVNPGGNPVIEQPRSNAPIVDGKSLQQVVSESKPFQNLPQERQAEILKGLTDVQRMVPQPNQGEKPLDTGAKPVDLGAKPIDTGIRTAEVKMPDGKPVEIKAGDTVVPGRVLDPAGNPLRGPDGNPMKFSDMIAAGLKPSDILKPGEFKPGEGLKPGDGLKPGESLKPGDAQKASDAIAGKAIDPALVAKLGEGLKPGLTGTELPVGKLVGDASAKDTKGGVSDGTTSNTTSALSEMAKALGLSADSARTADAKLAGPHDLKAVDGALKAAADALKPTTSEAKGLGLPGEPGAKLDVKADLKGLDAARPDSTINLAAKMPAPEGLLPGTREALKVDGAIGAKGEVTGKLDSAGRPESLTQKVEAGLAAPIVAGQRLEVDKNVQTVRVDQVPLPGDKLDPNAITKIELDPDKKAADTAGSAAKFDELIDKAKKQRDDDKFDEEDQLNSRNAMMMALLAQKKQKQEQEEKEFQLRNEDPKKKDDDKRRRYVVKEKETLESIAKKQLRDVRLAALIYEINKHMLPVRMEKGKQVVDPRPGTAIWLPTEGQIKEFRMRLYAATNSEAGAAAPGAKFASVDDELAAKFGSGWDGAKTGPSAIDGMLGSAVAKSQTRRENIEKILGPMSDKPSDNSRIRYIVRLTDSIESVAQKHPALKDASLWPLVASVNHLPTGLDQFGRPAAELRRGMVLDIPLPYEIERFRQESSAEEFDDSSEQDEDDENDYDDSSDEARIETPSSDVGVETSEPVAVPSDWEATVKVKSNHPLIASPSAPSTQPQAPLVVPQPAPLLPSQPAATATPSATPSAAQLSTPMQSSLAAQAAAAAAPSPYSAEPLPGASISHAGPVPTSAPMAAKPSFPFSSQQASASTYSTMPLPVQAPAQAPAQAPVQAPAQAPAPSAAPPPTFTQAPPVPQPASPQPLSQQLQQHTVVSQPVAPRAVSTQSSSQTDTNPVLSAVPVLSQIQSVTGAQPSQLRTALDQPPIDAGDRFIWQLDPSVRLVKSTMKWDPSVGVFRSQLELLLNEIWYPVIFYEVFPNMAVRHEYIGGGRKKSVKMDLPPTPAQELADNDLVNNWQRYCHTFVAQMNGPKTGPPS